MKRLLHHCLFWLAYYIQFCLIEYYWASAQLQGFDKKQAFVATLQSSALYTLLGIGFCYYMVYTCFSRIVRQRKTRLHNIAEIILALGIMALAERVLANYIIFPYVYCNVIKPGALLRIDKLAIVVVYAGFALGLMVAVKSIRVQFAAAKREQDLVREKLDAELKYLKNQINPHFLFNTMNNIYVLARKKADTTADAVLKLSELLSFMLYEAGKDFIPVRDEIKLITDYIDLQKLRYSDRLNVSFTTQIDNPEQGITPLLLISPVENAFKHGASESRLDSYITVTLCLKQQLLQLTVSNSIEVVKRKETCEQIGLTNIRRQLELLYKEHLINVRCTDNEFEVQLNINLNSHAKA